MDILLQILFGSYAGWMVSNRGNPMRLSVILGILGAMASNLLMESFGRPGVYSYNPYSFFVAITGAVAAIHIGRLVQRITLAKVSVIPASQPLPVYKAL